MPDGRRAVSGGIDGTIRLWDLDTGKLLQSFQNGGVVWSVVVSPDGRYVFSAGSVPAGNSPVIKIWDMDANKVIQNVPKATSRISGVWRSLAMADLPSRAA